MAAKRTKVPRHTDNPIDYLLAHGQTLIDLASAWDLTSTDNLRKLRVYSHVPRYRTAALMAETFGWSSGGEVMDFWAARVAAREAEAS